MPIKFIGEPLCVSKEFWYQKVSSNGGGSFTILSKVFLFHRTEKTSPGNHSVFQKTSGREKLFMDKRGRWVYHDFPSKFLSHCTEIFHWRTIWCFRKTLLSKFFIHGRRGGGGGCESRFFQNFWLTGPKRKALKGNPSVSQKISAIVKILWIRGGISRSSVDFSMSHCADNFPKGILLFSSKYLFQNVL